MITVDKFVGIVQEMCRQVNVGKFTPILEADLAAFIYHSILVKGLCPLKELHINTRIINSKNPNAKFDLVSGPKTQRQNDNRPAVKPETIVEIKFFPRSGFSSAAHSEHFKEISKRDLRKLKAARSGALCIEFIYDDYKYKRDGKDYLSGHCLSKRKRKERREKIIEKFKKTGIKLVFARRTNKEDKEVMEAYDGLKVERPNTSV